MQKVLRRTALAKNQAKRKTLIIEDKKFARDRAVWRSQSGSIKNEINLAALWARRDRKQDWEMGPLAPWRETSPEAAAQYGTWSSRVANPPKVPEKMRVKEKDCFFKVGDRVCVVEGREGLKGAIGKLKSIDWETQTVRVEGLNRIDIRIPSVILPPGQPPVQTIEGPIPLSSLRLIYPLPDPMTGIPRDCLINNLVKRNSYFDIYRNAQVFDRILMPQNLRIPWPPVDNTVEKDEECDTLRINVEEQTFLPTLLRPPMPMSVIDECRGRYSRFRDRHDPEWVTRQMAEDEAKRTEKERGEGMRPHGARNVARRGPSAGGGRFMVQGKIGADVENRNLEALGAYMAEKGVGLGKGRANKFKAGLRNGNVEEVVQGLQEMAIEDTPGEPERVASV